MYARIVECTLKPDKMQDFDKILSDKVFPRAGEQPGFVDLIGMVSDGHPGLALAITVWEDRQSADRFYAEQSPMMEFLSPLMEKPPTVAHYTVTHHRFSAHRAA
jgi:quinol monooxygenase YgiN